MEMELDDFRPTDSELLKFLLRFIGKEPLRDDGFIMVHDVYKQEPWETYSYGRHCGGHEDNGYRYFVTPIHKKKRRLICRTVGQNIGIWKPKDGGMISCHNQRINGRKTSLFYQTTNRYADHRNDGKWIMEQYALSDALLRKFNKSEFRDYAICAIKNKSKKPMVDTEETTSGVNFVEPLMDELITPIDILEPTVQIQEAAGALGLTTTSQVQESMITDFENLMLENYDMDHKVLEKNQTQQEESSLVADLVELRL